MKTKDLNGHAFSENFFTVLCFKCDNNYFSFILISKS